MDLSIYMDGLSHELKSDKYSIDYTKKREKMETLIGFLISVPYLFFLIWELLQHSYAGKSFDNHNNFYNIWFM